jgi:hypothetical protein
MFRRLTSEDRIIWVAPAIAVFVCVPGLQDALVNVAITVIVAAVADLFSPRPHRGVHVITVLVGRTAITIGIHHRRQARVRRASHVRGSARVRLGDAIAGTTDCYEEDGKKDTHEETCCSKDGDSFFYRADHLSAE